MARAVVSAVVSLHSRSFGSLSGLLDQSLSAGSSHRPTTPDKPLPLTPQPSDSMLLSDDDDDTLLPSVSASSRSFAAATMSKRYHALVELLTSERVYARNLAFICDIHLPLAPGLPEPFVATPATSPGLSVSSSRTLSTASGSSAASCLSVGGPPMTREDAKIIFNNVIELAVFADELSDLLEAALGDVLEGGTGPDCVGALFLQIIPSPEPRYNAYIMEHATALQQLDKLPQTPALSGGLSHTRTLASTADEYPLLLKTTYVDTLIAHPDKNLEAAIVALERVTQGMNELGSLMHAVKGEAEAKKTLNTSIAASVSLGRMRSLRSAAAKAKEGKKEEHTESEVVKEMAEQLRRQKDFLRKFAKDSQNIPSEAFEAFLKLINDQLLPVCDETKDSITERLLPLISSLVDLDTLEPIHNGLMNIAIKTRLSQQPLASRPYIALRGQRVLELPSYLKLLDHSISGCMRRLAGFQQSFYSHVPDR
ncbi:hypothetical protein L227DRAFT_617790 [Lentinus tigrinus ALCF2SS1-6]|uniref:DH domain-containing protein n=1 Tax=Lentinus tigrinus ALCF2SS1-6 TaxID=1328759 RepID=A0A5C2RNI0_9APHY|nr:hypothetical protein L227DRAFT_617790 [Lentinus tigrinus ALCF2SS1-6]